MEIGLEDAKSGDENMCMMASTAPLTPNPMVDSGAVVTACPRDYASHFEVRPSTRSLKLQGVNGAAVNMGGMMRDALTGVRNSSGRKGRLGVSYEIGDLKRPVLSVAEMNDKNTAVWLTKNFLAWRRLTVYAWL